jgi:hypothetical protein
MRERRVFNEFSSCRFAVPSGGSDRLAMLLAQVSGVHFVPMPELELDVDLQKRTALKRPDGVCGLHRNIDGVESLSVVTARLSQMSGSAAARIDFASKLCESNLDGLTMRLLACIGAEQASVVRR